MCLHKRLLTLCRPADRREKYQVCELEEGIKPDRITTQIFSEHTKALDFISHMLRALP